MSILPPISNAELVIQAFGRWPSLHDGYLRSFSRQEDVFVCEIHGWNMTSKVNPDGYFILERHHRVAFRFSGITDADLHGLTLYEQSFGMNILGGLRISHLPGLAPEAPLEVHIESVMDPSFSARFRAQHAEVLSVTPCDAEGQSSHPRAPSGGEG
jgi:hypothetical protein